jgi:hypothetical protein
MRRLGLPLLLLGLLSTVCARPGAAGPTQVLSTPAAMSTSLGPSTISGPTPLAGARIITRADQGQTLHLVIGDTFTVRLEGDTGWEIQITDPRVVGVFGHTATSDSGEHRVYRARTAGVTELVAVAPPPCTKDHPPCRVMAPAFRVLIVVR